MNESLLADVRTLVSSRYSENSSQKHPRIPTYTCANPCTPHIPAYTLNLINHMKLHLNRGNRKKAEEEDRKKEGTRVR